MKHFFFAIMLSFLAGCANYQSYTDTINLNGQDIFYAVEGKGRPVILLHGNGGSHNDLETMQRQLAQAGYTAYALDSRGQGANKPLPEYHYKDMARDVYEFIRTIGLQRPAVYGWSDGGIVALELESMFPGTCSLLVTSGANICVDGAISDQVFKDIFGADDNIDSLTPLVRMMRLEPNMTPSDMQNIRIPVLVCAGENDLILPTHTQYIVDCLPNAEKRIIPGEDHGSYIWHNPMMGNILLDFLRRQKY